MINSTSVSFSPKNRIILKYFFVLFFKLTGYSTFTVGIGVSETVSGLIELSGINVDQPTWGDLLNIVQLVFTTYGIEIITSIILFLIVILFIESYRTTITYHLKTTEILSVRGLITKSEKAIPYRTITNFTIKRDILDRFLGLYTIEIQTAGGTTGTGILKNTQVEEIIEGITKEDIDNLYSILLQRISTTQAPPKRTEKTELIKKIHEEFKAIQELAIVN
ncbi:MAG: PH domain-containing protein [Candidatus Heimdallarchaeota archaeon]|nr:PH domain-containing protein [Candidatus Heimdallarchaeota archaeon]MDH5647076.1 PH domain-containing protein [Candidatus Heimdallarchaeota archaeon]